MDYILKLLDEDENWQEHATHSEADVDAFTAELSRHLKEDSSLSQPNCSNTVMSQGVNDNQHYHWRQHMSQNETVNRQRQLDQSTFAHVSYMPQKRKQPLPGFGNQPNSQAPLQLKQDFINQGFVPLSTYHAQYVPQSAITQSIDRNDRRGELLHMNRPTTFSEQGTNGVNNSEPFRYPIDLLVQLLLPHLDKKRSKELTKLYLKVKKKEISSAGFSLSMKRIAGEELCKAVFSKYAARVGELKFQRAAKQWQGVTVAQNLIMPSPTAPQCLKASVQVHQQGQNTLVDPSRKLNSQIPCPVQHFGYNASVQKPITGQKKQSGTSSQPSSSKKKKVSKGCMDQSIKQLNDVIAITGIELEEEEDLLFTNPMKSSLVSEASRREVQEKGMLISQKALQEKLKDITLKSGITDTSNDVEQCLSMCVEERMLQLIRNLIRQSKNRIHFKIPKDGCQMTSDVGQEILLLNQKSTEQWRKKQAEIDQGLREIQSRPASDAGEEKEEFNVKANMVSPISDAVGINFQLGRSQSNKEDKKSRIATANAAARVALGGNYKQLKWQLRASSPVDASSSQFPPSEISIPNMIRDTEEHCSHSRMAPGNSIRRCSLIQLVGPSFVQVTLFLSSFISLGSAGQFGKADEAAIPGRVDRTISVRDVIAVLEREPQMAQSPLLYRLYNQLRSSESSAELNPL